MKRIAHNFKGRYSDVVLGPLFKLVEAVLELMVPLVVADIIDTGIRGGNNGYIVQRGLFLVLIAVLSVVSALVCQYFAARAAGHFGRGLRMQLYTHVMTLPAQEIEKFGAGGIITRLTSDVNQIQTGINMAIRLAVRAPFLAVGSVVMALILNWRIGLIFLASTPLIVGVLYFIMKRTVSSYTAIQAEQDNLSRLVSENLAGVRVIRAFSRQELEQQQFEGSADELTGIMVRVGKISAALSPITSFIVNLAIIAIMWVGAKYAFAGSIQPGVIVALVTYMTQTLLALFAAAHLIVLFTRGVASTKRVAEVLNTAPSISDGPGAGENKESPVLEFDDVSFAYHKGAGKALEHISFAVQPGQTLGIIGGTGSGKTTLVALLMRYFDASEGRVLLRGADVKDYTLSALRAGVGLVPQAAALFSGTIRFNMQIAAPDATDEEVWRALHTAQAADFVKEMPQGLDTLIEEGGKNLSGGQRQRLTIARALVREPRLLVLDDAASALDYATDAAMRSALKQDALRCEEAFGFSRTVIMISQRAATIKSADLILVLDDGRMSASGTHQELLQKSKIYREICASQGLIAGEVASS